MTLKAGCPVGVPALTVNRLCGSGLQALVTAAQLIKLGEADVVLAGGAENMSQQPHIIRGARWGLRFRQGQLGIGELFGESLALPFEAAGHLGLSVPQLIDGAEYALAMAMGRI